MVVSRNSSYKWSCYKISFIVGGAKQNNAHTNLFSFQQVLHDWCNKGRSMFYPVCGMMHIKEPLLLIGKSNPCEWSFTICLTPYNRK